MPPLKSLLIPHSSLSDQGDSLNIIVKLNNDLIHTLKDTLLRHDASMKPKLIVKNGDYYLKLNQDLITTKKFKETSRIDLYSNGEDVCLNLGKIDMRLNLLYNDKSRLKRIQSIERPRSEVNNTGSHHLPLNSKSVPNSPHMSLMDFKEDNALIKLRKLIHILSLGPITVREINSIIKIDTAMVTKYGMLYVEGDDLLNYPFHSDSKDPKYVLKDIYYKNLSLFFYTDTEKPMILHNFNLQMTKMGYQGQSMMKLKINHEFDEIINNLQITKERKLKEKLKKLDELKKQEEELKRKEEESKRKEEEIKKRDEKKEGEDLKKTATNDKQALKKEIKKRITPPPPPPNTLKTRELKKKRTISESSNSSVNSMKSPGEDVESPISSQEEVDDDISLNEIKRQKVNKLSTTQIELFKKFKAKFQIYSNLYQSLSTTKSRSRSDFQKLTILENEVKSLKRKLYNLEK